MKVKLARIAFMTIPLSFFPGVVFYLCAHTARSGAPAAPTECNWNDFICTNAHSAEGALCSFGYATDQHFSSLKAQRRRRELYGRKRLAQSLSQCQRTPFRLWCETRRRWTTEFSAKKFNERATVWDSEHFGLTLDTTGIQLFLFSISLKMLRFHSHLSF